MMKLAKHTRTAVFSAALLATVLPGATLQADPAADAAEIQALRVQTAADSLDALVIYSDENLCRRTLSAAEMDALIQLKKSMMGSRSGSIWGRLKKLFSWLRSK